MSVDMLGLKTRSVLPEIIIDRLKHDIRELKCFLAYVQNVVFV